MTCIIHGIEAKPCPFCGGGDVALADNDTHDDYADRVWIVCEAPGCGASGAPVSHPDAEWGHSFGGLSNDPVRLTCEAEAVRLWNRRTGA